MGDYVLLAGVRGGVFELVEKGGEKNPHPEKEKSEWGRSSIRKKQSHREYN